MKTTLASILAISALMFGTADAEGLTVSVGAQQARTDIGAPRHDTQAAVGVGYDFGKVGPVNVEGQLNYVDLGRMDPFDFVSKKVRIHLNMFHSKQHLTRIYTFLLL